MPALHFGVVIVPDRAKRRMTTEVPKNRNNFVDLDSTDIETNCRRYPARSSPPWEVSQLVSLFHNSMCLDISSHHLMHLYNNQWRMPQQTNRFSSLTRAIDHKTSTWSLARTLPRILISWVMSCHCNHQWTISTMVNLRCPTRE